MHGPDRQRHSAIVFGGWVCGRWSRDVLRRRLRSQRYTWLTAQATVPTLQGKVRKQPATVRQRQERSPEIVKGVADSAERSVETTRKWFELSQRPFVYPAVWQVAIVDRNSRRARVVVQLTDSAEVPATAQKVCIWQDRVLIDYDRRPYEDVTVRERSLVFGPVYYNVNFRDIVLPEQQDQGVRMHLSLVYTFAPRWCRATLHVANGYGSRARW